MIHCIAIDDEPIALRLLAQFIEQEDSLVLKSTFISAYSALKYLEEQPIDCVFLDIEMPDLNGVELVQLFQKRKIQPIIVFVSAYSHYAIEGFKVSASDFLLKPYSKEDFMATVRKVKSELFLRQLASKEEEQTNKIFIKVDARQVKIQLDSILYIESMKDYVKIYTTDRAIPYIPLMPLKKIKAMIGTEHFIQINRSQIIAIDKMSSYGKTSLTIRNKAFLVSEKYKKDFQALQH